VVSGAYAGEEPREHNAPQSHPDAITEKFEAAFFGCRGCGEGSCCTRRCKDTAGCPQSQRTLHWRASQTSRFEMGNFGAELRPIGLVFPSWKLNLASFGLEIVQAPPRAPSHAAPITSPRHERGGGAAPGHWGRGFRAPGWDRCCGGPNHRSGRGAPGLELLGAEQLGEEWHRRCEP